MICEVTQCTLTHVISSCIYDACIEMCMQSYTDEDEKQRDGKSHAVVHLYSVNYANREGLRRRGHIFICDTINWHWREPESGSESILCLMLHSIHSHWSLLIYFIEIALCVPTKEQFLHLFTN